MSSLRTLLVSLSVLTLCALPARADNVIHFKDRTIDHYRAIFDFLGKLP